MIPRDLLMYIIVDFFDPMFLWIILRAVKN